MQRETLVLLFILSIASRVLGSSGPLDAVTPTPKGAPEPYKYEYTLKGQ